MNIYHHSNFFQNNKYTNWYYNIIEEGICQADIRHQLSKNKIKYHEKHHILPKSIFPHFKNEKWNIVLLTPKEHFLVHCLLVKMTNGENKSKMSRCMRYFKSFKKHPERYVNSRLYEQLKGFTVNTQETKNKISEILRGRTKSIETRERMSKSAKGKIKSPEHILNISNSRKGNPSILKGRITITNGKQNKIINFEELSYYKNLGFYKGCFYTNEQLKKMNNKGKKYTRNIVYAFDLHENSYKSIEKNIFTENKIRYCGRTSDRIPKEYRCK